MEKCEAGCKVFDGGERRHHKDCFFYPDSLSEMYDKLEQENAFLKRQNYELLKDLGLVKPKSAIDVCLNKK